MIIKNVVIFSGGNDERMMKVVIYLFSSKDGNVSDIAFFIVDFSSCVLIDDVASKKTKSG